MEGWTRLGLDRAQCQRHLIDEIVRQEGKDMLMKLKPPRKPH